MAGHIFYCLSVDPHLKDLIKNLIPRNFLGEVKFFGQVVDALNALSLSTPEKIFINIQDYPRHWKVFRQIIGSETELVLYSTIPVEEKEERKIQALGLKLVHTIDQEQFPSDAIQNSYNSESRTVASTILLTNGEELFITEVTSVDSTGLTCRELPPWEQLAIWGTLASSSGQVLESLELSRVPGLTSKLLFLKEAEKVLEFLR